MKKLIGQLFFLLFLLGVCKAYGLSQTDSVKLPHFDSVNIEGPVRVTLVTADKDRKIILPKHHDGLFYTVQNHTLTIEELPFFEPQVVTLCDPSLRHLHVGEGAHINSLDTLDGEGGLVIEAMGNASVRLRGVVNIAAITAADSSKVNVHWVNSHHLMIRAYGGGSITLAGTVDQLSVRLQQGAKFDGTYLRSQIIYAEANDGSLAYVLPIRGLYAFAEERGQIFYYKSPQYLVQRAQDFANVLQMGNIS